MLAIIKLWLKYNGMTYCTDEDGDLRFSYREHTFYILDPHVRLQSSRIFSTISPTLLNLPE